MMKETLYYSLPGEVALHCLAYSPGSLYDLLNKWGGAVFFSNPEGTVAVCSFCVHRNPYLASSRSPWFVAQRWSGKEVALQVAVKGFFFMWCYFLRFLRWDWTPLDSNFIIWLSDLLKGRKCGTSSPTARCNSRERERGGKGLKRTGGKSGEVMDATARQQRMRACHLV